MRRSPYEGNHLPYSHLRTKKIGQKGSDRNIATDLKIDKLEIILNWKEGNKKVW